MDDQVAQFVAITDASPEKAQSYLRVSDYDLQQAIQLFFDTGGADMDAGPTQPPPLPARSTQPITIDDDDDMDSQDMREAMRASNPQPPALPARSVPQAYEDDEALARRLQEEFYSSGGGAENGVRAPIAKTRETLVEDDGDYAYLGAGSSRAARTRRAGIFNQRTTVWDGNPSTMTPEERQRRLAEATGGASSQSSHAGRLANLFRPPVEIISHLSFEDARDEAKDSERWILVNVQDDSVFQCQTLNRDIWKDPTVQQTIKEHFIFLQMNRNGVDGRDYMRLYMPNALGMPGDYDSFPHIAIIDPRTGEQVKVWSQMPATPMEMVHTLHEFLERYSLKEDAKNPVQRKTKPKIDVDYMTEEEMLQLAMQNSLGEAGDSAEEQLMKEATDDNDLVEVDTEPAPKTPAATELTPFQKIAKDKHHEEPSQGPDVTRIQFKLHDGSRVVRRFRTTDRVERLFEYVKADLLPEKLGPAAADLEFDLVSLGKRLIEVLDLSIEEASLKMGTIMVETVED